jgi:hypothetical protein
MASAARTRVSEDPAAGTEALLSVRAVAGPSVGPGVAGRRDRRFGGRRVAAAAAAVAAGALAVVRVAVGIVVFLP